MLLVAQALGRLQQHLNGKRDKCSQEFNLFASRKLLFVL